MLRIRSGVKVLPTRPGVLWRMAIVVSLLALVACGGSSESSEAADGTDGTEPSGEAGILHPDVLGAEGALDDDGTWTISATISSPYDTPERYADAWRVLGPNGDVLGIRELTHDHQAEQPFTRSQSGIEIPEDVDVVIIEGRDQISGWGGERFELRLDPVGGE